MTLKITESCSSIPYPILSSSSGGQSKLQDLFPVLDDKKTYRGNPQAPHYSEFCDIVVLTKKSVKWKVRVSICFVRILIHIN